MNAREFAAKIQDRIRWMEEQAPELLDRPVVFFQGLDGVEIRDVFVEEFLCLNGKPMEEPYDDGPRAEGCDDWCAGGNHCGLGKSHTNPAHVCDDSECGCRK